MHALAAGRSAHLPWPVGVVVAEASARSELDAARDLRVAAGGDPHLGAQRVRDLQAERRDAGTAARDQQAPPGCRARAGDGGAPRRQAGQRKRGRLLPAQRRGLGVHVGRRDDDALGERPFGRRAEDVELGRRRALVVAPVKRRVDHDLVAGRDVLHAGADRGNPAGAVRAERHRGGRAGRSPQPPVAAVECCGHELDHDLAATGHGVAEAPATRSGARWRRA